MLKISLFGHFSVQLDDADLENIHLNGARRLLALLTLYHDRELSADWVAEELWPETASEASLRKAIQQLRRSLGTEVGRLRHFKKTLRFDIVGAEVDLVRLEDSRQSADLSTLELALQTYCGPLLAGWDEPWVIGLRRSYETKAAMLVDSIVSRANANRNFARAAAALERALALHPDRETWWLQLVEAYVKCGDRMQAASAAQRYERLLTEIGTRSGVSMKPPTSMASMLKQLEMTVDPVKTAGAPDPSVYEPVSGPTPLGSRFYVERPVDRELHSAIAANRGLVQIRGSRKTGKSSLLLRGLRQARDAGASILRSPWQHGAQPENLNDIASFYRYQAALLAKQANTALDPTLDFDGDMSPSHAFGRFMREQILDRLTGSVVWAIDDADYLFSYSYCDDVFGLLRTWYNERGFDDSDPINRLTVLLTYSAEAHLAIKDLNRSPFNVGFRLSLTDFTLEQAEQLNRRYGAVLSDADVARLHRLTGGHPYLLRRAFYALSVHSLAIDNLLAGCDSGDGIYVDHLNRMVTSVLDETELADAVREVLNSGGCSEVPGARLCAAGVLDSTGFGRYRLRCEVYDRYFRRRLP